MLVLTFVLLGLALIGHAAFWVGLVNRWHATGLPRAVVKSTTLILYAGFLVIPLVAVWLAVSAERLPSLGDWPWELSWATGYLVLCSAYGLAHAAMWLIERWEARHLPPGVRLERQDIVDMEEQVGFSPALGLRATLFARVPGNQLWKLHVPEFSLNLPRVAPALDGISICHWSDLHISGRIDQAYFHEVVRLTNEMDVDLIALTGDICDAAHLIDWLPDTFGPAKARAGKFFILGNHDLRTKDTDRLRDAMREAGFIDVGSACAAACDGQIMLAGDERPWFPATPCVEAPPDLRDDALRILLAHTPDQLGWAREHRFDIMLAGHTHGGQIRLPVIGPVVCPSWHGVKYAGGFYDVPPTILHVSRGTASLLPLRLNCPPEMTKLVLRSRPSPS